MKLSYRWVLATFVRRMVLEIRASSAMSLGKILPESFAREPDRWRCFE